MTTTFAAPETRAQAPARTATATTPAAPRFDMYASIHKALRSFMTDTLFRVGRVDVQDADDLGSTLVQVHQLLDFCRSHIAHENEHVHRAIDARLPAGAARTAEDHDEHIASIAALRIEAGGLQIARDADRPMLALRLYRHLALFVAENFQHMHIEETVNNAAFWAHYSDAELMAIHGRILAGISPQEHLTVARWMVPAVSPFERALVLGGMKTQTPPEALLGVLAVVRPHLDARAWAKLAPAIGVTPTFGT